MNNGVRSVHAPMKGKGLPGIQTHREKPKAGRFGAEPPQLEEARKIANELRGIIEGAPGKEGLRERGKATEALADFFNAYENHFAPGERASIRKMVCRLIEGSQELAMLVERINEVGERADELRDDPQMSASFFSMCGTGKKLALKIIELMDAVDNTIGSMGSKIKPKDLAMLRGKGMDDWELFKGELIGDD